MRLIQINGVLLGPHVCAAVTLLEKTMRPLTTDDRLHDCSLLMFVHVLADRTRHVRACVHPMEHLIQLIGLREIYG